METIGKYYNAVEVLLAAKKDCKRCLGSGVIFVRVPIPQKIITKTPPTMLKPMICGCTRFLGKRKLPKENLDELNKQIQKQVKHDPNNQKSP